VSVSPAAPKKTPGGVVAPDVGSFEFSEENRRLAEAVIAKYPKGSQQSAVLPLLHLAQKQHGGWLPRAASSPGGSSP
jgi:NADH:ubiquinone oxidoreductase subunit E